MQYTCILKEVIKMQFCILNTQLTEQKGYE